MGKAGSKHRGDDAPRKSRRRSKSDNPAAGITTTSADGTMKFIIDSRLIHQRDIQKRILQAVEAQGYHPDSVFAVKISLEEALINAIKHGNKLDPSKKVHVVATVSPRETEIIVEDEGPGFNRAEVPDPTAEENLLKCSGRGILLMETYMDRVEFSKSGRRVRMLKRNTKPVMQKAQ
jgi:serine/threonine-protein kinase RsbW